MSSSNSPPYSPEKRSLTEPGSRLYVSKPLRFVYLFIDYKLVIVVAILTLPPEAHVLNIWSLADGALGMF